MTSDNVVILIAEDDGLQAVTLEGILTDGGYSVITASNGAEAIRMLGLPDLLIQGVITDIQLGIGPEGWDVARHAREIDPTIPVLYVSGDSSSDWTARGVPNSNMLTKPYADAQIIAAISTLLNDRPPSA